MRALIAILLPLVAEALAGEHRFVSPNGEFQAYTIAANDDGTGMKLYLHRANAGDSGILLRENNRWIDAKWSPDSQFLAVVDHLDGHISDVYVFTVTAANAAPLLVYHTPDLRKYDVKWDVVAWDVTRREIILEKQENDKSPGRISHEKVVGHIGTKPLKFDPTE